MADRDIFEVFFREKPALILIELKNYNSDPYASVLSKKIECTYSHVVRILNEMKEADLVTFREEGRLKITELTDKGEKVASQVEQARDLLKK